MGAARVCAALSRFKATLPGRGVRFGLNATKLVIASLVIASPTADAAFSQGLVTGTIGVLDPPGILDRPGGFVSSISGFASGGNPDPGFDAATAFVFTPHIVEDTFVSGGTASAASMFPPAGSNLDTEAAGNGTVRLGRFSGAGRAQQTFQAGVGQSGLNVVHGGWVDTVTINAPGLTGTQAIWLFRVDVANAFDASGYSGSAIFEIEPYVNQNRLPAGTPGFHDGDFNHPVSTSVQHAEWRLTLPSIGAQASIGIIDTATFAAEITIGTPFDLGIFAVGWAAARTNSASPAIGSIGEFDSSATWGGDAGLNLLGGAPIGNYQITSLSGTDWTPSQVPLPGMVWMTVVAAAALLANRRRAR